MMVRLCILKKIDQRDMTIKIQHECSKEWTFNRKIEQPINLKLSHMRSRRNTIFPNTANKM